MKTRLPLIAALAITALLSAAPGTAHAQSFAWDDSINENPLWSYGTEPPFGVTAWTVCSVPEGCSQVSITIELCRMEDLVMETVVDSVTVRIAWDALTSPMDGVLSPHFTTDSHG